MLAACTKEVQNTLLGLLNDAFALPDYLKWAILNENSLHTVLRHP